MKLVEIFTSINGEGKKAGELSVFIRFPGCNLRCSYCDTMWANESNVEVFDYSLEEISAFIKESGAKNLTVTGGEPLLQNELERLLKNLHKENISIEIETNGSVDIQKIMKTNPYVSFTMDYKMPSSGMEDKMYLDNLKILRKEDTLKLVCGSKEDLAKVLDIIPHIKNGTSIYLSPVFGEIEAAEIVSFMMKEKLSEVKLQLQLHKFIWHPDMTGV